MVQKEEKFNYQQTKYRIILSETEMFYIFDVFDEDGKPAIIDDGEKQYIIRSTISKYPEDLVLKVGIENIFTAIKQQIKGAHDHYEYVKNNVKLS